MNLYATYKNCQSRLIVAADENKNLVQIKVLATSGLQIQGALGTLKCTVILNYYAFGYSGTQVLRRGVLGREIACC